MIEDKFTVGLRMTLNINQGDERLMLSLQGWEKGSFLLAGSPLLKGLNLTSNDDCIIRFVKDGIAYGFETSMLSLQYFPSPLIFFKYPREIKSMQFRKARRVKTNIPARFMDNKGTSDFITEDARIVDLSENGCLVQVPAAKFGESAPGRNCYLTFMILDKSLEVDCRVRNVRSANGYYMMGTEFNNFQENQQEIVSSFIYMFTSDQELQISDN